MYYNALYCAYILYTLNDGGEKVQFYYFASRECNIAVLMQSHVGCPIILFQYSSTRTPNDTTKKKK